VCNWHKDRYEDRIELKVQQKKHTLIDFNSVPRQVNIDRVVFSNGNTGITIFTCKIMKLDSTSHHIQEWIIDLNIRMKLQLLEESMGINIHDLGLGDGFFAMATKAQVIKEKLVKLDLLQCKNL
jgi:hypothetical protein